MWDERYAKEGFSYGTAPNDFLREQATPLKGESALCLCAGEGRNAVWLASLGQFAKVVATDQSAVGLAKAAALATEHKVELETRCEDLESADLGEAQWDLVTCIFGHTPPSLRKDVHRRVVNALRPGGHYIAEFYSPAQLGRGTGGPPNLDWLVTLDMMREELAGLEFIIGEEREREIHEGAFHNGMSSVTQVVAKKPA